MGRTFGHIIFAAALAALVSCTKVGGPETAPLGDGSAIGFSAYAGGTVTKGVAHESGDVIDPSKGIGVFAFYQPAANGKFNTKKYGIPNFMYNVQVTPDKAVTPTKWNYSPIKYWPNNDGDMVSFFAYAPFDAQTSWEDLGFRTDVNGSRLSLSLPVYDEKEAMQDYMFAAPTINMTKPGVGASGVVSFAFQHVMSKVAINIGAVVDQASTAGPQKWTDPLTKIVVTSVEIDGIATSYDYTCPITSGGTLGTPDWEANGSQDLVLTSRYGDFQNDTISTKYYTTAGWKPLLSDETVGGATKPGYLFIAPQDLTKAKLTVTYKVYTSDPDYRYNGSVVTNKIEKPLGVNFESGKAYTLNLLIGMTTVKFSASVTDWDESTPSIQVNAWGGGSTPVGSEDGHYYEGGTDYGEGITINGVTWAPVNCGYDATSNPYGKLYQWGRKDGQGTTCTTVDSQISDLSNLDPATFYKRTSTPYNWYIGTNPVADSLWKDEVKTVYDPCPAGWRVAKSSELLSLITGGYTWTTSGGQPGMLFGTAPNQVFFPASGNRLLNGTMSSRGSVAFYWSSTAYQDKDEAKAKYLYARNNTSYISGESRAFGYAVRCVKQ